MGQGRRQFTDESKQEAVALLASSGRPLLQLASELGISLSMLRNWRNRSEGRNAGPTPHSAPGAVSEIFRLPRERSPADGARHFKRLLPGLCPACGGRNGWG